MKKLMYIAAALLVLVGCNNKENVIENAPQNLVTITGGIDFSAQDGPNKIAAKDGWESVEDGEEVEFVWEEGDEIAVMSGNFEEFKKFTVSSISQDGKTATFVGEPLSCGMETFKAAYPYEYGAAYCNNTLSTWACSQQYTGKLKLVGLGGGGNNLFKIYGDVILDLSLIGSVKLGKINYYVMESGEYESEPQASISMGEGGLQLKDQPQHVTFAPKYLVEEGFKLSFYDTEDQLIMEKEVQKDMTSYEWQIVSFPTLEVKAAPTHEYVDLGLSVNWATCNVGATNPEDYGDYFAWGEVETKTSYSSTNYTYTDNPATLPLDHDAAAANWGGNWRMPTKAEWDELKTECTWTWCDGSTTKYNNTNVKGFLITGKKEGYTDKSIFLPASGYCEDSSVNNVGSSGCYWSSSLDEGDSYSACLYFLSGYVNLEYSYRYFGQSVRPVVD